jgi:hypothetical protein
MNVSGSFRDPAGRVFSHEGVVLREVRWGYRDEYNERFPFDTFVSTAANLYFVPD